jgi:O-succinylbenzoic acid--CoA ligase
VAPLPADDPRLSSLRAAVAPGEPVAEGTAIVVCTSGSTGEPKAVELSASALLASAQATHTRLGGAGRWELALPAHHIAGIQVLVRSILAGEHAGARYTSLVPTQLTRLVERGELAQLRAFDAVLVGGAAAAQGVLDQAREAGVPVVTTYGMTETAGGCVYDGRPLDGVRVRVVDGVIELGGRTLATGYRLAPPFGQWFRTADLGELHDGLLTVRGRIDDMINTGGVKVAAPEVERVLLACPGVSAACVVGLPDEQWGQVVAAAVVADRPAAELVGAVRSALGPRSAPKVIRVLTEIPLLGSGKVDMLELRRLLTESR